MNEYIVFRDKAVKHIKVADHMLSMTFPLVKDTKLLLTVVENIFLAYSNAINALLTMEAQNNENIRFDDNFESRLNAFSRFLLPKYKFDKEYIKNINEVKTIIMEHKKSPIEFARNEKYVICSDSYKLRTLTINELKEKISKAKLFIEGINNIFDIYGAQNPV